MFCLSTLSDSSRRRHLAESDSDSSSSRMRVIYHWSATKQRPHPQGVAEISCHSVLSGDNVRHRLGLATRTQISVCKSPFPSAGTAVFLLRIMRVVYGVSVSESSGTGSPGLSEIKGPLNGCCCCYIEATFWHNYRDANH